MTLTEKQKYWQSHLTAAESFDGPLTDYAKAHDLDVKKLYVFKGVLRDKSQVRAADNFVKIAPQPERVSSAGLATQPVMVALPNGVKLSLPNLDQPNLLERLADL